jgi:hypothetical protein
MLRSIDILLGLSVVMLMVSLVVTVLTGAVTNFLQTRGKNLAAGIAGLLRQIHPDLPIDVAKTISEAILTHPLIASDGKTLGAVVHREELIALILELAAGQGSVQLAQEAKKGLTDLLKNNGIEDPAAVIANVRSVALTLEQAHPELSNNERVARAFLQEAHTAFLGKINGWFDQTIDRVADRFTNSTRIVTFVASFAVALVLQLDTAALVSRLNADPTLRQTLVNQAVQANGQTQPALQSKTPEELVANLRTYGNLDIVDMPTSLSDWAGRWSRDNAAMKLLGILLTTLLLSLGAPFWYNALKNLIRLRSLIAQKDDDQRAARQTSA